MNRYSKRITIAFVASLGIHFIVWVEVPAVMAMLNVITGRVPPKPPMVKNEVPVLKLIEPKRPPRPTTFVETDASQESQEKPKESKFYSDRSSLAANPKADQTSTDNTPKLEGKQDKVPSTANVPLPQLAKSETPKPEEVPKPEPEKPPAPKPNPSATGPAKKDLAMLTKDALPKPEPPKPAKPKTDPGEAKLNIPPQERIIPEQESKMKGGAARDGVKAFDVTGVIYGEYDRRLIAAIKTRWIALIEQHTIPGERSGQVAVRFHLNVDGTVSELSIAESTAGDMLALYCQKAITDSAPYGPWPDDLKDMVKRNYREWQIVFYYAQ
jgi:outer membrane biosynthesis protein TonB